MIRTEMLKHDKTIHRVSKIIPEFNVLVIAA